MKKNQKQKVVVIGLGYVGLPLAIAIEESKLYDLVGFDINKKKVELIKNKRSPFVDNDVEERLHKVKLFVTSDEKNLKDADIYINCVPTPVKTDYEPDLGPIIESSKTVAQYLKKGATVVVESTVNPGVCEEVVLPILEKGSGLKGGRDFHLVHCPERINPGDPKWNVYNIPRNIGSLTKQGTQIAAEFYRNVLNAPINEVSSLKVAEATKIIENTFRDINIAYVNELAKSFDKMGVDLIETLKGASNKPFGFMPHWPGCGVGGHCIAVDPYYLIKRAAQSGFDHKFLKMARDVNNSMPAYAVELLIRALNEVGKSVKGTKILLYGLSYKPNIGDLRESPSLEIRDLLKELDADLSVYDPYVPELSEIENLELEIRNYTALIICTAHDEIKHFPIEKFKGLKVIVDGRNCLDKQKIQKLDILYKGIGR